ncbi:unnamed protein product [Anisakis simplex]|uniref:Major sperm protein n=1 Tax=Anisakis simplex TaxID=6269 RepID=A0A0M3JZD7_ANISI|nr:unnamed protein product [Anisakis simplex]
MPAHMISKATDGMNLYVHPRIAEYSASKGGGSRHLLVNSGTERIVIKIKCSNNDLYRVSPVYSFLNPGRALRLYIVRDPGPAKVDKLIVIYMSSACKNPREAFATSSEDVIGAGDGVTSTSNGSGERRKKVLIALVAHDLSHRMIVASLLTK